MKKVPALQICTAIFKLLVFLTSSRAATRTSAFSPGPANFAGKSSILNLQQGACPAEEVGEVGGETSGAARVRAGFAPNRSLPPAQRSLSSGRGFGGGSP